MLFTGGDFAVRERNRLQANFSAVAPGAFYFDEKAPVSRLKEIADKVEQFYFGSQFSLDDNSTFPQLCHLYSDRMFLASGVRFMNLYAKHAPTFPYLYTFNKVSNPSSSSSDLFVGSNFDDCPFAIILYFTVVCWD